MDDAPLLESYGHERQTEEKLETDPQCLKSPGYPSWLLHVLVIGYVPLFAFCVFTYSKYAQDGRPPSDLFPCKYESTYHLLTSDEL